jgi:peroxiredoxin
MFGLSSENDARKAESKGDKHMRFTRKLAVCALALIGLLLAVDQSPAQVSQTHQEHSMALHVGDKAPEFTLVDTDKKERSLKEFAGKPLVLAFYPGAFTGVCTKEMCAFRDALANFNTLHAQVVGISIDSPFANKAFAEKNNLAFPLLCDYTKTVSKAYCGLTADFAGLKGYDAARRSVFVIDAGGTVRYVWLSDTPANEPPYDEVKAAVAKL